MGTPEEYRQKEMIMMITKCIIQKGCSFLLKKTSNVKFNLYIIFTLSTPSFCYRFHADLVMAQFQVVSISVCDVKAGLEDCVNAIRSAGSHTGVTFALTRIHLYLLTDQLALKHNTHSAKSTLQKVSWHEAVERYTHAHSLTH